MTINLSYMEFIIHSVSFKAEKVGNKDNDFLQNLNQCLLQLFMFIFLQMIGESLN